MPRCRGVRGEASASCLSVAAGTRPLRGCSSKLALARAAGSRDAPVLICCLGSLDWEQQRSSEQVVFSRLLQDKEDGEPKAKQLRDEEEEGEKHR